MILVSFDQFKQIFFYLIHNNDETRQKQLKIPFIHFKFPASNSFWDNLQNPPPFFQKTKTPADLSLDITADVNRTSPKSAFV